MSADGQGGPPPGGNSTAAPPPFALPEFFPISARSAYLAQVHIGLTSTLLLLGTLAFCVRIYQRIRPVWKMGADDYFIIVGFVSAL